MAGTTDYGRRDFLKLSALLGGDLALNNGRVTGSLLEEKAEAEAAQVANNFSAKKPDDIASLIAEALRETERGRSSRGYRSAYEKYETAINFARNSAKGLSWNEAQKYKELEIVALMGQSYLLTQQAGNNIVTNETIKIKKFPVIHATRKINHADKQYNFLRAIQNYERVEEIWEEAKKQGKGFPYSVNMPVLGNNGLIARPVHVYQRTYDTINLLTKITPNYRKELIEKELLVTQKLKSLLTKS